MINLANEFWDIQVAPEHGGSILSCEYQGFPVLRPATQAYFDHGDVFETSYFPLIPYSNRIAGGQFEYLGKTIKIPLNRPDQTFPIHGNGWSRPWTVSDSSRTRIVLTLNHPGLASEWPWSFKAVQTLEIIDKIFTISLELENQDELVWPAGIGMHPFFSNSHRALVKFQSESLWLCDKDLIPTQIARTDWQGGFAVGRGISDVKLDNCFVGWGGKAEITWPDQDLSLELSASNNLPNLVVYMQPENDFFCLEPVSHINNALNTAKRSLPILKKHDCLSGFMSIGPAA